MNDIVFKDCEFRYLDDNDVLCCKNKQDIDLNIECDNCVENIHLNCQNYVPKNDMCLQYFQLGISEVSQYDECAEKKLFSDDELQRKWSN